MNKTWCLKCGVSGTGKGTFNEIRHVLTAQNHVARRPLHFPKSSRDHDDAIVTTMICE